MQSDEPGWPQDPVDRQFQAALISWLQFHGAMLIGELVPEALRFLRNNPNCEARAAYDHVIVDEYQDLNRAEQELIELLSANGSLALVGDIDQSIYRFRHANPEGIQGYAAQHPGTHDETLDECRRCPLRVVAIADHLIGHNHPADGAPRLRPLAANPQGEIHIVQWTDLDEEARGLAGFVDHLVANGYSPGDVLVLTPRRLIGYGIRDQLENRQVAVHSFYHEEALESAEAQRAFALLTLLVNNEDRVALRWWLGEGSPSNRRNAYQRLRANCEQRGISPRAALEAIDLGALIIPNISDVLTKYRELKDLLRDLGALDVTRLIDALLPDGVAGCDTLREAALLALPGLQSAEELFDCIRTFVTQPEMPEHADFVRVMSLHKSKGLTSRVAIISGCTQGLIPYEDNEQPAEEQAAVLREQRRLFYVALTRCTEILVLSSVTQIDRALAWTIGARVAPGRSAIARAVASQFMDELGPQATAARRGAQWIAAGYAAVVERR